MISPILEVEADYDLRLNLLLSSLLAIPLILGFILLSEDIGAASAMFGITVFDTLLFYAILPRYYQIFQDRLKIVLGYPFAINISFSTMKEARVVSASKAFIYWGIRFATSQKNVVEIVRNQGLNLVISPAKRNVFLDQLSQVLKAWAPAE